MNKREAHAPFGALGTLSQRLWPHTQGSHDDAIYARLVNYLYACQKTVVTGAIGVVLISVMIAWLDGIEPILWYIGIAYVPINVMRTWLVVWHARQKVAYASRHARRLESVYACSTLLNTISIMLITMMVIWYGQPSSKFAMACVVIGIATAISGRNASMPRLVRVQTTILLGPMIVGLICSMQPLQILIGFLALMFFNSMQETTSRLQRDTIEAREQAILNEKLALYDSLTGLANRKHFETTLKQMLSNKRARNVLYVDLDRFKHVNDSMGHPAGDEVLKITASRLKALVEEDDGAIVARFGGDEFVIMTSLDGQSLGDRIVTALSETMTVNGSNVTIGGTVGIATPGASKTASGLIKAADIALYAAKEAGKNRAITFNSDMERSLTERSVMERRLRQAIGSSAITVHFQPIIDLRSGEIVCAEALARWTDSELGTVSPAQFIPLAGECGLIDKLGEDLLLKACAAAAGWRGDVSVAVNVSAIQFRDPRRLYRSVRRALAKSGLPGSRLEIEMTESVMIGDFAAVARLAGELTDMGVRIALDDFGSGYCSLNYLSMIPFSKIKIDRSLSIAAPAHRGAGHSSRSIEGTRTTRALQKEANALGLIPASLIADSGFSEILPPAPETNPRHPRSLTRPGSTPDTGTGSTGSGSSAAGSLSPIGPRSGFDGGGGPSDPWNASAT